VPDDRLRWSECSSANYFVTPSWIEPFGIVYVEAAVAGLPSIGPRSRDGHFGGSWAACSSA
jgi:hypothetical protein